MSGSRQKSANSLSGAFSDRKTKPKRPSPLSIRLKPGERAKLEKAAAGMSLNGYVCSRLFDEHRPARQDKTALAQVLGKLGQMGLASDFNALAEAARIGALPVTDETEASLMQACDDIQSIKSLLMAALRIKES